MIQKVLVVFLNRLRSLRFVFFKKELVESCPVCNSDRLTSFAVKRWTGVRIKLIQCTNCKLVLQSPRLTQQSLNMFYSHSYRGKTDYNHKQKMFERGRRRGAYISEFLLNSGVVVDRKTVVYEVGCGYGGILDYFRSQYDCTVLGSDIDASINDFSLEKGLDIKKGSLEVFSKGKADIIILSHILEHISSPLEFLKNLKNLMRENGVIYVEVPGIKHPKVIDGNLGVQPGHLLYFDKNTAINTFKEAGYKVVTSNEVVQAVLS